MTAPPFPIRVSQQVADVLSDRPRAVLFPDREHGPLLLPEHIAAHIAKHAAAP